MSAHPKPEGLDRILALQLAVAWAGEAQTEPPRLGWWSTSLCDELGGEDLFRRLTPRTWRWAVLEAARSAARKVDAAARAEAADADDLVSLFRLGFELDERLDDRLAELKRSGASPTEALPDLAPLIATWDRSAFTAWGEQLGRPGTTPSSIGRRLKGDAPEDPVAMARLLAAALVPLADRYPAPHFKVGTATTKGGRG